MIRWINFVVLFLMGFTSIVLMMNDNIPSKWYTDTKLYGVILLLITTYIAFMMDKKDKLPEIKDGDKF
jgi:hypothetical protein